MKAAWWAVDTTVSMTPLSGAWIAVWRKFQCDNKPLLALPAPPQVSRLEESVACNPWLGCEAKAAGHS